MEPNQNSLNILDLEKRRLKKRIYTESDDENKQ